jgi:hypothetical protein
VLTGTDADLARLLAAFLRAHRRLLGYAGTHLAVRESDWEPGGHFYLTDFRTGTMLYSQSGIGVIDPDGDVSGVDIEAAVRPDPTGFDVRVAVALWASEQSTTGWPEGRHLLHEERRHCTDVPEAVATLTVFVDRLCAIDDPLASVAWTRR